jgi:CBS domain-containing membrane protein
VFGLGGVAGGLLLEPSYARIAAAAFALGLTSGILLFLRALHPPAGATTMIVALGLMPKFAHIGAFLLAASFIWLHATLAWRPRGVAYPIWS